MVDIGLHAASLPSRAQRTIEVIIVLIGAVAPALLAGYLAELLSFKVKDQWCPDRGTTSDLADQHAGARAMTALKLGDVVDDRHSPGGHR